MTMTVHMTLDELLDWQVSVEERLELLEEVKAGEKRETALRVQVDTLDATLRIFEAMVVHDQDVIDELISQLAHARRECRRALASSGSATKDPRLNRFSDYISGHQPEWDF